MGLPWDYLRHGMHARLDAKACSAEANGGPVTLSVSPGQPGPAGLPPTTLPATYLTAYLPCPYPVPVLGVSRQIGTKEAASEIRSDQLSSI